MLLAVVLMSLSNPSSYAQSNRQAADLTLSAGVDPSRATQRVAPAPVSALGRAPSVGYHLNLRSGFDHLARFVVPNAQDAVVVGPQTGNIFGMDYDGEVIWGFTQDTVQLGIVDQNTAAFTPTVAITGLPAGEALSGLTIAADGTFLISSSSVTTSTLSSLNPTTGVATPIGIIANAPLVIALAINCAGELYGHELSTDSLIRIPVDNPGATTVVGLTGQNANFAQGMDFDDATNTLYAWLYRSGGAGDFVTMNLATGAATVVTPLEGEFEGLIMTTCPLKMVYLPQILK